MARIPTKALIISAGIVAPIFVAGCSREQPSVDDAVPHQASVARQVADVLSTYCGECHAPPRPRMHAAAEWPAVVARMQEYRSKSRMPPIPPEELDEILGYLQQSGGNK